MKYRRTTLIAVFCASLLAGLGLSRRVVFSPETVFLLLLSPFLLLIRRRNLLSLYLIILAGLALGMVRGNLYMQKLHQLQSYSGQKIALTGTVKSDAIYGSNYQLEFSMNHAELADSKQPLAGNIKVSGFGLPMVYRGDKIRVEGKIHPTRGSYQANMSYARISLIGADHGVINDLTRRFSAGMRNALPEPMASFSLGLLVGQRSSLPPEIINQLTAVGLIHIVAVSGYNVTILSRAITRLKVRSRYQRLILSLGLIGVFVLITGFSASIVRAAIVSGLALFAWYYGLRIRPIVLIAVTAAGTAYVNPFYAWGDLSWYLSFLAFFGVLIVAPMIHSRFSKNEPKIISSVLLETLSAELMTLPLILAYFSQLSLVAPLANLLVVPLVPLAMLLSAIAGAAGMIIPQLAGWLAWPAEILLTYMLDIAHLLSRIPASFIKVSVSTGVMILFYVLVLVVGGAVRRAVSRRINSLNMIK